jgi:hypothetical protein
MYDDTLKKVHFQKSRRYLSAIRQCFSLSATIFHHPQLFSTIRNIFRHPQLFSAIHNYFPLSTTIFRYPQLFSAIRNYFAPSASVSRHPQLFSAVHNYFPLSATNSSPQTKTAPSPIGERDNLNYFVNCSSSVEPFNAVVEDVPPVMTMETWSK